MSRKLQNLPEGDRPITNLAIARTRFIDDFQVEGSSIRGQFYEVIKRIGIHLELARGEPPMVVPNKPIIGTYLTGTTFRVVRASVFTNTSKMPGPSFAIPAGPPVFGGTCPAAALGENVSQARQILQSRLDQQAAEVQARPVQLRRLPVLGEAEEKASAGLVAGVKASYAGDSAFTCRSCYALGGNYVYPSKQVNDMLHLAWIEYELAQGGPSRLGTALAYAIQHINLVRPEGFQPYFRIHDAGDFHHPDYLEAWVQCASMMTHMRFWAPTRQWVFKKWVPLLQSAEARVRRAGGCLTIRPSVLRIGDVIPMLPGLSAGSGVSAEAAEPCVWVCPVYNKLIPKVQPDGTVQMEEAVSCLEANCTACWDQPGVPVSYGAH